MPDAQPGGSVTTHQGLDFHTDADGIAEVVIDRYDRRNALSTPLLDALLLALDEAASRQMRVLILRGQNGFFCAGADIDELTGQEADRDHDAKVAAVVAALMGAPFVSIAAIERGCIGAGLELATACDVRIADPSAFFALPTLEMGLVYRPDTLARLSRLVGHSVATRLVLMCASLSATEAYRCGLITALTGVNETQTVARELAVALAAAPPEVVIPTTRLLTSVVRGTYDPQTWAALHHDSFTSPARLAAVTAKKNRTRQER